MKATIHNPTMTLGLILILLLPTLAQSVMADPSQARIQDVRTSLVGATTTPLAPNAQAPTHRITLITGDVVVVTLFPDGRKSFAVEPVNPREEFKSFTQGNDSYLVPSSARLDKLDMNLFDVDYLLREKYDELLHLPLLVTSASKLGIQSLAADQFLRSRITRTFAIVPVLAAQPKISEVRSVYDALVDRPETARIWLDRVNHVNLNESVPLIGAPSVWATGYDGSGIKIAILDTGIDATHPDVSGKIVTAVDLTDDGTTDDLFGHGTHVAVIAAGTGIASEGKFKGVAPGASLMNIKVLNRNGWGYDSWIISGIEYAANNGANVISMSLGGMPTDGNDPLSQAVDATVMRGVVAAVAAGNSGDYFTVGAPGAARQAITVGATDKSDSLAWFSSRGPTVDFRVKPDVLAPGVNIISGHAANCILSSVCSYIPNPPGQPSNGPPNYPPYYTSLSGTSMATPHVSGLIALVKQRNPSWTPAFIKDALINTALQLDGYNVYEQGGGRIQAPDAVQTTMLMDPGSYSFGVLSAPPVAAAYSDFSVNNLGGSAFDVSLSITLVDIQSGSSYSSAVTMNVTSLSVPSSSSKGIRLTIDLTSLPTSVYSGLIYATRTDGKTIHSVFGFAKLRPVTVTKLNRQGDATEGDQLYAFKTTASSRLDFLMNYDQGYTCASGTTFLLADGTYTIASFDRDENGITIADHVEIHSQASLTLDEKSNMPITFDPALANQEFAGVRYGLFFDVPYADPWGWNQFIFWSIYQYPTSFNTFVGVTSAHALFGYEYYPSSAYNPQNPTQVDAPSWGELLFYSHGVASPISFVADYSKIVKVASQYSVKLSPSRPGTWISYNTFSKDFRQRGDMGLAWYLTIPQGRTEFMSPDTSYMQYLWSCNGFCGESENDVAFHTYWERDPGVWSGEGWGRSWGPGESFAETWNGIMSSELNLYVGFPSPDKTTAFGSAFIDGYLHHAMVWTTGSLTVKKGDSVLFTGSLDDGFVLDYWKEMPFDGFGTYEFLMQGKQGQSLSTEASANFTMNIESVGYQFPPLIEFRSDGLDLQNTAIGSPVPIVVRVETPGSVVTDVTLKYSMDDGVSWIPVNVKATPDPKQFSADIAVSTSGYVSLWATARDGNGNTVSQIVKRAYLNRPWSLLDGLTPDASALAASSSQLFLGARGMENGIWYRSVDVSGIWGGWIQLPGFTDVRPAIQVFNNRFYFVCKQAGSSNIWYGYYPLTGGVVSGSFSGWTLLPGPTPTALSVATDGSYLYVAAEGMDGSLWHQRMSSSGSWSGWVQIPGFTDVSPAIAVFNGRLYFACKQSSSNNIWYGYTDLASYPGGWSGWTLLVGPTPDALALAASSDHLYLAARGMENGIWYRSMDSSGSWTDWSRVSGFTDVVCAIVMFNGEMYFVCKQAGTNNIWYC